MKYNRTTGEYVLTVKDLTHAAQGTLTATSFQVVNDHVVTWYLPGVFNGNDENNLLQIAGGKIQSVSGATLAAYSENYTTDNLPPRVVTAPHAERTLNLPLPEVRGFGVTTATSSLIRSGQSWIAFGLLLRTTNTIVDV